MKILKILLIVIGCIVGAIVVFVIGLFIYDGIYADNQRILGNNYYEKGDYDSAIEHYSNALGDGDYRSSTYLKLRGRAYFAKGDFNKALDDFTESIKNRSYDKEAYIYRAEVYAKMGDYVNAIADYESIIKLDPGNSAKQKINEMEILEKFNNFWGYILENEKEIFGLTNSNNPLYYEMYYEIQLINENIYLMLDNEAENNKKNIIITSGGKKDYFDLCDLLVSHAPVFSYLNPISLFPPLDKIEPFIYEDIILAIEDFRVYYDSKTGYLYLNPNNKHFEIILNYDKAGEFWFIIDLYNKMLSIMLQQLLGEKTFAEKIKRLDISFPEPYGGWEEPDKFTYPMMELKEKIK